MIVEVGNREGEQEPVPASARRTAAVLNHDFPIEAGFQVAGRDFPEVCDRRIEALVQIGPGGAGNAARGSFCG